MVQIGIFLHLPGIESWSCSLRNVGRKRRLPFPNTCPISVPEFFICLFLIFYTIPVIFCPFSRPAEAPGRPYLLSPTVMEGVVNYRDLRKRKELRREIDLFHFVKQKISLVCAIKEGGRPKWVATGTTVYVKTRTKK